MRMTAATMRFASVSVSGQIAFREGDGGDQRAAPGAKVLRRELLAHVFADVLVQLAVAEVDESAVLELVAEEPVGRPRAT